MPGPLPSLPAADGGDRAETAPVLLDFSGHRRVLMPAMDDRPDPDLPAAPPAPDALVAAIGEKLAAASFGERAQVFAEPRAAWQAVLDTVRAHQRLAGRPKRHRLILCLGPEDALPPGLAASADTDILRTDDAGTIIAAITPKTAGIFIAPVRLGAGIDIRPGHLLADLRTAADEYGLVLVFDESTAGIGRTGMAWAHEWRGITPDLMVVEGLAGPAPLTALVATAKLGRAFPPAGPLLDPLALADADTTLAALTADGFDAAIQSRGWQLEDRLAMLAFKHREVFSGICGTGLLQGLVTIDGAAPLQAQLEERGLLTAALGDVLGIFPPLDVTEEEIDAAAGRIAAVCEALALAP